MTQPWLKWVESELSQVSNFVIWVESELSQSRKVKCWVESELNHLDCQMSRSRVSPNIWVGHNPAVVIHWRPQGEGGTGAMTPPLARESGVILSFGPTFDLKGSMPPSIGHMELLAWMQRADFSEHIQGCKSPGDPLNSSHFDAPNTKSAPTGYRRAPNIISHHYKQQLSAKASIVPKARPIRFR